MDRDRKNGDGTDKVGDIFGELWHNVLEKFLNFTTVMKPSPDGLYGSMDENGTWNGIIGNLHKVGHKENLCNIGHI